MAPPTVGEVSFLWSGFIAKCELRQLLDELFEDALLAGRDDPWERSRVLEEVYR